VIDRQERAKKGPKGKVGRGSPSVAIDDGYFHEGGTTKEGCKDSGPPDVKTGEIPSKNMSEGEKGELQDSRTEKRICLGQKKREGGGGTKS